MKILGWPFPISVDGDLEQGFAVTIGIDFASPLTNENLGLLTYAVESFAGLGAVGGLGGDRVSPMHSVVSLGSDALEACGAASVVCQASAMAIDARALIVLFNALAFLVRDVARVSVQAQGDGPPAPFSVEDLPPPWPHVPFQEDDDRTGPNVELQVEFAKPLTAAEVDIADEALQSWLDCGSIQCYRDWSVDPGKSFLAPAGGSGFGIDGDQLAATLEDSGVLEGCYDILTNVLVKLDALAPIARVELV